MPDLDAMARYTEIRAERGLGPHDDHVRRDLELLDFFLVGVVEGTRNVLLKIKEHKEIDTDEIKRVNQTTAVNGAICISPAGETITRCVDDPDYHKCEIYQRDAAPWCHGPIPMNCPLPRAVEEE